MATTVRGGSSAGKEKRGTSPSGSLIKKSPKTTSSSPASSSSSPTKEANSSPTDSKSVPNYLKPTISSNLDFSRLSKKSSTDASAQKPALNRRRSFDRPPSASQVHKAIRNVPGINEMKSLRSSSFSHKPSSAAAASSTRPASERSHLHARSTSSLKDSKPGPHMTKSLSLKKSTLSSAGTSYKKDKRAAPSSPAKKKAPKSVTSESSVDYDNSSVDQLAAEDDLVNIDDEGQSLPEISEMPDSNEELGDPTITEEEVPHVDDVQEKTLPDEHPIEHEDRSVDIDQVAEEAVAQESETIGDREEQKEGQIVEIKPEPENAVEAVETTPEPLTESEEHNSTEVAAEDKDEGNKEEPTTEPTETLADEKKEDISAGEQEAVKVTPEEAGAEDQSQSGSSPATPSATTAAAAPAKPQPAAAGKKEKQVYNDIIEETKTKLMGGRKNKVLALAGAFETVISLQDNNKN